MAGIGVTLNKIFSRKTITTHILGSAYGVAITVAPMLLIIATILLMGQVLGLVQEPYAKRELFSCITLYMFVFSLIAAAPTNAVFSRYLSDVIFEEDYAAIMPCFYIGLFLQTVISLCMGVPFCIWIYLQGQVSLLYIVTGYCGFMALILVFYSMIYLSICKDYKRIALYFLAGAIFTFTLSLILVHFCSLEVTYSMLLSLTIGLCFIGSILLATIKSYFREYNNKYERVLVYFKQYYKLIVTNSMYIFGLYIHNFVFWNSSLGVRVAGGFLNAPPYDMATFLGMATSITSSVIFLTRVEMHFHVRYRAFSEAVIGGRGADIKSAKERMFAQLSAELMNLVRIQFIISVVVYLFCVVILPGFGFSGLVMQIYPCLAAGYFILFIMYAAIIFLYYYNDLTGSMLTSLTFFFVTWIGSRYARTLPEIWYGLGLVIGSTAAWAVAYTRLRWVERNLDRHIFCQGQLIPRGRGKMPPQLVYESKRQAIGSSAKEG
ncbi:MAG: exopolysaccharide Pel transporter PelG [Lachnospiraceae bacterium]|jgi:uncharacterized membrane protein|nr:exopolysaccharide Pel transporter PelG [Lachnospiraceae bacterium]